MKLVLRACAAPLRPAHLAYYLKDVAGAGMSLGDAPHLDAEYHGIAIEAMKIQIEDDTDFLNAVRNLVFSATKKPIAKLTARNQFLAIAPSLEFAGILVDTAGEAIRGEGLQVAWIRKDANDLRAEDMEAVLGDLMPRPFVMGLDLYERLERVRVAGGALFSPAKLQGYVEQHLGTACVFTYDR